ncbi:MAG TPA: hypothetical protein VFV27_00920 [Nevskiaceae bacterium]|nr:hypothetical protein [Nevskiaceae bacterium]
MSSRLLLLLLTALLTLGSLSPRAQADDIEIYTNSTANELRPPLTVLVLDLNLNPLDVICSNALSGTSSNCQQLRSLITLGGLFELLSLEVDAVQALVNAVKPIVCPVALLPCPLTLSGLVNLPLAEVLANPANLVLKTALGLVTPLQQAITSSRLYRGLLRNLLRSLVDSRVAVLVPHADRGTATVSAGKTYRCNFADLGNTPGNRVDTTACSNGGYVLLGFIDLANDPAGAGLNRIVDKVGAVLGNVSAVSDISHPFQGKELYYELYRYLRGDPVYNGHLGYFDYGDSNAATNLNASFPTLSWDTTVEDGANRYRSALDAFGVCDSVNVLNVMLTNAQNDGDSDPAVAVAFPGADQDGDGALSFAELVAQARSQGFTHRNSQVLLNSYFLINSTGGTAPLAGALDNLGFTVGAAPDLLGLFGLGKSFGELVEPVLSINASLLTPSQTPSLQPPGQLQGDAFFGLFRPAADQRPRWTGNVKKLRLVQEDDGAFEYRDQRGREAIAGDGRIRSDALTFWTQGGSALGGAGSDGREAALGGAGQRIPGFRFDGGGQPGRSNSENRRRLFFDLDAGTAQVPTLTALNADDSTVQTALQTALGATSQREAQELLLYARGYEVGSTSQSRGVGNDLAGRDWLHGAVLHSRPVAINYGARGGHSASNPDIRVLYGASDGLLRLVRNTESGGSQSGVESWAFLPRAVMAQQKILRDNSAAARFPYGVDGAPSVLVQDRNRQGGPGDGVIEASNDHDRVWAYVGLRRGGRHLYALDLTDPDDPALLWRLGPDGLFNQTGRVTDATAPFAELALSFSSPQIGRIRYLGSGGSEQLRSVVMFTAGYNGGRDGSNGRLGKDLDRGSGNILGRDDALGTAIYLVDAETGELIWKAAPGSFNSSSPYSSATRSFRHPLLVDSFPSDLTLLDTSGDGLSDRFYVADSGGRLWRGDFPGADRAAWTLTPLASVGRHDQASVAHDRRFFHAPDYVPYRDRDGAFDVIVFASGDREDPNNRRTENYLYAFRDGDISSGKTAAEILTTEADLADHDDFADLTSACASGNPQCAENADLSTGWKIRLSGVGEKTMSQPLTTGGTVFLSTYVPRDPEATECAPGEGSGKLYAVSLRDSRPRADLLRSDSDGDARSQRSLAPGLVGELTTLNTNTVASGAEAVAARARTRYRIFWLERRGEEDATP